MADRSAVDLSMDTVADAASLALLRGDEVIAEHAWVVETTMSRELLGQVAALLTRAEVSREEIVSIAVATGPGRYGAVRTGVATAQGLALGLDIPLAGVGRFEADAATLLPSLPVGRIVVAVHEAGRAGMAWAAYTHGLPGGLPTCVVEPRLSLLEELVQEAPTPATWCGELTEALRSALGAARDAGRRSGDTESEPPPGGRAAALVRLARARGSYGDPALVDAFYLRPPSITRAKSREA